MEQLKEEVLKAFGDDLKIVKNIQRYATYVCKTSSGMEISIKKFKGTEHDALFLHNIKNRLKNKGFTNIDTELLTLDNQPYFSLNDEIYVCSKKINGNKIDFTNQTNFLYLIAELGRLHKVLNSTYIKDGRSVLRDFNKESEKFVKLKKQVNRNNKKNDIDFMFLKEYNKYEELISKTREDLLYLDYENYSQTAINLGDICFNSYDENNFLVAENAIIFNDFSNAKFGVQVNEIAELIYKYFKSCKEEDVKAVNINYIIDAYKRNNEVTGRELLILQTILNYPQKYLKNIFNYYGKRRSFVPTETIMKLQKYSEIEGLYYDYISDLKI